jgi:hypothetical protein
MLARIRPRTSGINHQYTILSFSDKRSMAIIVSKVTTGKTANIMLFKKPLFFFLENNLFIKYDVMIRIVFDVRTTIV